MATLKSQMTNNKIKQNDCDCYKGALGTLIDQQTNERPVEIKSYNNLVDKPSINGIKLIGDIRIGFDELVNSRIEELINTFDDKLEREISQSGITTILSNYDDNLKHNILVNYVTASALNTTLSNYSDNGVLQNRLEQYITAESFNQKISNVEGNISTLSQTASGISAEVQNAKGDIANLKIGAEQIESDLYSIGEDGAKISKITQTANNINTQLENYTPTNELSGQFEQFINSDSFSQRISEFNFYSKNDLADDVREQIGEQIDASIVESAIEQTTNAVTASVNNTLATIRDGKVDKVVSSTKTGWDLSEDAFTVTAKNKPVLEVNEDGLFVSMSFDNTNFDFANTSSSTGIYLGPEGLKIGQKFKVTPDGVVEATGLVINLTDEQKEELKGDSSYLHIRYSNDGGTTFTGNNGKYPGDYVGQYVDDNPSDSNNVSSYTWTKIKGEQGASGTTITNTSVTYAVGDSGINVPSDELFDLDIPTVPSGKYLWSRTTVVYSNGTSTDSYNVSYKSKDGSDANVTFENIANELGVQNSGTFIYGTKGNLAISADAIKSGLLQVGDNNNIKFLANKNNNSVKIGGFEVTNNSIYKNRNAIDSNTNGIYIGTDGISIQGTYNGNTYYTKITDYGKLEAYDTLFEVSHSYISYVHDTRGVFRRIPAFCSRTGDKLGWDTDPNHPTTGIILEKTVANAMCGSVRVPKGEEVSFPVPFWNITSVLTTPKYDSGPNFAQRIGQDCVVGVTIWSSWELNRDYGTMVAFANVSNRDLTVYFTIFAEN